MWGTSQGNRTLKGDEADLVRKSVGYLRDMITAGIDLNEPYRSEVGVFNRLQPTQQLAALHEVAYGLLDPATPILELTSCREATVYAIYREVISLIEIEIELAQNYRQGFRSDGSTANRDRNPWLRVKPEFQIRSSIIAACQKSNMYPEEWAGDDFLPADSDCYEPPQSVCEDLELWSAAIEFLSNQVLWDRDFEMEAIFADQDPEKIADIKAYLGIHEDYFSTPAPDVYSDEYQRIDRELVLLTKNSES
jgi:hypothetical protein